MNCENRRINRPRGRPKGQRRSALNGLAVVLQVGFLRVTGGRLNSIEMTPSEILGLSAEIRTGTMYHRDERYRTWPQGTVQPTLASLLRHPTASRAIRYRTISHGWAC
jgi:hypothetical protein